MGEPPLAHQLEQEHQRGDARDERDRRADAQANEGLARRWGGDKVAQLEQGRAEDDGQREQEAVARGQIALDPEEERGGDGAPAGAGPSPG